MKKKRNSLHDLSKLWSPFDKKLVLSGIRTGTSSMGHHIVSTDPVEQFDALKTHWSPTFTEKLFDKFEARKALEDYVNHFDFSSECPVDVDDFFRAMKMSKAWSAPGPDGIPFGGWTAVGMAGAQTLHLVAKSVADGLLPPL